MSFCRLQQNEQYGACDDESDTQLDNLSGQMTILKSALEGLVIELLMLAIRTIVGWVQQFVDWLHGMEKCTKKVVVTIALLAMFPRPVLIVIGKVMSAVGMINYQFSILTRGKVVAIITLIMISKR